jgi:hypothetical protein
LRITGITCQKQESINQRQELLLLFSKRREIVFFFLNHYSVPKVGVPQRKQKVSINLGSREEGTGKVENSTQGWDPKQPQEQRLDCFGVFPSLVLTLWSLF